MDVTYLSLVIFGLVVLVCSDNGDNRTTEATTMSGSGTEATSTVGESSTETTTIKTTTELIHIIEPLGTRGLYGGSYYNRSARNPKNNHYIHGFYQPPQKDYYKNKNYYRDEGSGETFDYYLGFGVSKMTDKDFQYDDFHYYYHDLNRTIFENETILSDFVVACHPNATFLCPENTETICLLNGTLYCMSKISAVVPCPEVETVPSPQKEVVPCSQNQTDACVQNETVPLSQNETVVPLPQKQINVCVNTVVPCVRACIDVSYNFEEIVLPCLSTVVVEDVNEDNKGKTLGTVGGTFVILDALKETERTFCVTVIVDPKPKQTD